MPRRPSEVADIGFSLPGLTSDLQDVTKQQQKTVLDKGPVCSSSAAVHRIWSHAVHRWCFVFPMGVARCWWKLSPKLQPRQALSRQVPRRWVPSPKAAAALVGCEPGEMLSFSSGIGFCRCSGKIPPSRRWAVHTDDQLHLSADAVSQGQDCFPAWSLSPWMGMFSTPQTGSNQSLPVQHMPSLEVLWIWSRKPEHGPAWR